MLEFFKPFHYQPHPGQLQLKSFFLKRVLIMSEQEFVTTRLVGITNSNLVLIWNDHFYSKS